MFCPGANHLISWPASSALRWWSHTRRTTQVFLDGGIKSGIWVYHKIPFHQEFLVTLIKRNQMVSSGAKHILGMFILQIITWLSHDNALPFSNYPCEKWLQFLSFFQCIIKSLLIRIYFYESWQSKMNSNCQVPFSYWAVKSNDSLEFGYHKVASRSTARLVTPHVTNWI